VSNLRLPPEDQPDTIDVGPIRGIPIIEDDDPRFEEDRKAWSLARADAQSRHSADELLVGLEAESWRVRYEVIDRLVARAKDDPRTLPALESRASNDDVWQVRDKALDRLIDFDDPSVITVLKAALDDIHPDVREQPRFGWAI
jgi:HEAT repeat protein